MMAQVTPSRKATAILEPRTALAKLSRRTAIAITEDTGIT